MTPKKSWEPYSWLVIGSSFPLAPAYVPTCLACATRQLHCIPHATSACATAPGKSLPGQITPDSNTCQAAVTDESNRLSQQ